MIMWETRIGEVIIVLHESGNRAMAVNHDEDPGDTVGHLPRVIALLTVLDVRTRGLRAGGSSLLWPPNKTLCKAS